MLNAENLNSLQMSEDLSRVDYSFTLSFLMWLRLCCISCARRHPLQASYICEWRRCWLASSKSRKREATPRSRHCIRKARSSWTLRCFRSVLLHTLNTANVSLPYHRLIIVEIGICLGKRSQSISLMTSVMTNSFVLSWFWPSGWLT